MGTQHVPVLVVGAGPVGMSTAMFLAHWGVRPLVIDKRDPTTEPPRAGISLRTHEIFRTMGLGPELTEAGWLGYGAVTGAVRDTACGTTHDRIDHPEPYVRRTATASPADFRLHLRQQALLRVLLANLHRHRLAVRFDTRLVDVTTDEAGVRAVVADTGTGVVREITADYLVAADGAGSGVRKRLGITMDDRKAIQPVNTAFYSANLGPIMDQWRGEACYVRNDQVFAAMFSADGAKQWTTGIMDYPGKPAGRVELPPARMIELLRAVLGDNSVAIDLHANTTWEAATSMASAFRRGRVFLAGDACHLQSAAGGLGMNTGIQDGHNLAWKLAAVLSGAAGPGLLDTYEPERRAAAEVSLALSYNLHRGLRSERDNLGELHATVAEAYLRGMLCYGYPEGAVCADGATEAEPDVLDNRAQPGYRFPHVWLGTGPDRVSTVDLIGTSWTLLCGPTGRPWQSAADDTARELGIELRCHWVGTDEPPNATTEQQEKFCVAAGIRLDGAVLVRPDGFMAWRSEALDPAPSRRLRTVFRDVLTQR